jgi:hypothetical protein
MEIWIIRYLSNLLANKAAAAIKGAIYKIYPGAPHGLFITEKEMLASDIRQFAETGTVMEIQMEPLPLHLRKTCIYSVMVNLTIFFLPVGYSFR